MIQEAAAKCRFCGEWLDPSKRPAWADEGEATAGPVKTVVTPVAPEPEPEPALELTPLPSPEPHNDEAIDSDLLADALADAIESETEAEAAAASGSREVVDSVPEAETSSRWSPPKSIFTASTSSSNGLGPLPTRDRTPPPLPGARKKQRTPVSGSRSISTLGESGETPPPEEASTDDFKALVDFVERVPVGKPEERDDKPVRPSRAYEDAFLGGGDGGDGGDDFGDDDYGDEDPFGSSISARPPALSPAVKVGGVALIGLLLVFVVAYVGGAFAGSEVEGGTDTDADATTGEVEVAKAPPVEPTPPAPVEDGTTTGEPEPPPPSEEFLAKLAEARALYEKGKIGAAGKALEALGDEQPDHPDVLLIKAQVLLETGKLEESLDVSRRCVRVLDTQADCWLTLGVLYQNSKEKEAAIAAYEKYLELAPEGRYARDATTQLRRLK